MPQKSHHASDVTQEIYWGGGAKGPLLSRDKREAEGDRDRDEGETESRLKWQGLFKGCVCCIWWLVMTRQLVMSPWSQAGRAPGS